MTSTAQNNHGAGPVEVEVEFLDDYWEFTAADEFDFGRGSRVTIHVDDNPRLHRRLGHVFKRDGSWWLANVGTRLPIRLRDLTSQSGVTLASGRETVISFPRAAISFDAGGASYEIELAVGIEAAESVGDELELTMPDTATVDSADIPLIGDQRRLLLALAEPALLTGTVPANLPSNKTIATRFGWTSTTFNRKLDRLCQKMARRGLPGLVGDAGALASDRRRRLVEYTLQLGLLTAEDLVELDEALGD